MDYEWGKPVKAVLDYFDLDNVTWLGISMGGWFCFRAAAFEPRINRVIASSVSFLNYPINKHSTPPLQEFRPFYISI